MFHYQLFKRAVNTEGFLDYLKNLKQKHGKGQLILYLDNLGVHKSKATKELYTKLNIVPVFSPIYSPELNPIEYVFSKLKQKVKKMRLNDMMGKTKRTFEDLVPVSYTHLRARETRP